MLGCERAAAATSAERGAPSERVAHLGATRGGHREAVYERPVGRGAGEPGQRAEPRGARLRRAPGAAQDAPRGVAVPAETPLWL